MIFLIMLDYQWIINDQNKEINERIHRRIGCFLLRIEEKQKRQQRIQLMHLKQRMMHELMD
jgi:hypothetical protein